MIRVNAGVEDSRRLYGARRSRTRVARRASIVTVALFASILLCACTPGTAGNGSVGSEALMGSLYDGSTEEDEEREGASGSSRAIIELTTDMLNTVPGEKVVQRFSLAGEETDALSDEDLASIQAAIAEVETHGDLGVVFFNAETGEGISYNADQTAYSASSSKAPFALYVCEALIDTGQLSRSDYAYVQTTAYVDDPSLAVGQAYVVEDLITRSITNSDNSANCILRCNYNYSGFDEWLTGLGIDEAAYVRNRWYPYASARTMAKFWTEMYHYVNSGSETGAWLGSLLTQTNKSYIRDGLSDVAATGVADMQVQNKAGWIAEGGYYSTSDNAIITADGETYIMSLMSSAPYSDASHNAMAQLALALFQAHGDLD